MAASGTERDSHIGTNGWKSPVEIRQLRVLVTVAANGSVSAAAVALGLAQSTVSESLAALDRAVGTPTVLRKRGAQNATLTLAGQAMLPHARRMLQQLDAAHCSVAAATHDAAATIDITANESVSTYLLSPALAVLRKRWPNARFSVTVATCPQTRDDVARGRCELGLLVQGETGDDDAAGMNESDHTVSLATGIPLTIFCAPGHSLLRNAARAPVRRDDISVFPIFVTDGAGDFHGLLHRYFTGDGMPGPQLEAVGSVDGVKRAVASDSSALGILPRYAVSESLEHRRVRALTLRPPPPSVELVALLPPARRDRHPALTELLALLGNS